MGLAAAVFTDEPSLAAVRDEWDRLAVSAGKPYCTPGWTLSWWRHAAPDGGELRVIAVRDGDSLIGIAPLWVVKANARCSPYEVLGARLAAPTGPVVAAGREEEVAAALTQALAGMTPRPELLELEGSLEDGWTERLAGAWPGRAAWQLNRLSRPLPTISIDGLDFEDWLGRKSSKFRQRARRVRRRLEDEGAGFGQVDRAGFEQGLAAFERLHGARWEDRGGSDALIPGLRPMLLELAEEWLEQGRMRIFTLELEGEVAAAWLLVAAGGAVDAWNTGFDSRWSKLSPAFQLMLHVVEDAAERGDSTICLGGGGVEYKLRLADRVGTLNRDTLVPRGAAYPLTRLRLAPTQVRRYAANRLPDDAKARLRGFGRRR